MRNMYPTVVKTCEGYDQNGVQGVFAVEDDINERGIQRFVCLFIKKANGTETIESQINNTNTSQLLSPEDRESDRAILRKAAREGYVYDRDSVGQRCKKLFKNEGSWRGQFPDSPYYGCRFSHSHK